MIAQNQTIDGLSECQSPPVIAARRPSICSGMFQRPTNETPDAGASATVASACSLPSCHSYACPPATWCQLGGVLAVK